MYSYAIKILKSEQKFFWYTKKHTKENEEKYRQLLSAIEKLETKHIIY